MKKFIILFFAVTAGLLIAMEAHAQYVGNTNINGNQFDSGAVAVSSTSGWTQIARIPLGGKFSTMVVQGNVGAGGALNGLKFTRAATNGGTQVDWITSFSSTSQTMPEIIVTATNKTPDQAAASETFQVKLVVSGAAEVGVWANVANSASTLEISGTASAEVAP